MEVRIERVRKMYKQKQALADIEVRLPSGSFTAILGPSGCGKTTLMRCLAGFLECDAGVIRFGAEDVTNVPPQKRGTAMVFQNYALWPHMSVFDNIAYGLKLRKLPKDEIERKVYDMLRKVEIDTEDVKKRMPTHYSGGQQQRIALARALVLEPKLLLMDEPLSNLDVKVRQRLRVEIRRLQQELGITAVYVTHDQEEALQMADQIVLMNQGRIEQVGSPEELYRSPRSFFAAQFIGSSNLLKVVKSGSQLALKEQRFPVPSLQLQNRTMDDGPCGFVFRSDEARIAFGAPDVGSEGMIALRAKLMESQFVGSSYRHWLIVEGQDVFLESEDRFKDAGDCVLMIPGDKCFLFSENEMKSGWLEDVG
ncbi:ABC transporter ATP-binding protein [Paenibacillus sp. TRM 82003]|nr:ABC transporter ATP-binding protein [Paenibacillus sp. TRM 82003]